jgi:hypothetical protein
MASILDVDLDLDLQTSLVVQKESVERTGGGEVGWMGEVEMRFETRRARSAILG